MTLLQSSFPTVSYGGDQPLRSLLFYPLSPRRPGEHGMKGRGHNRLSDRQNGRHTQSERTYLAMPAQRETYFRLLRVHPHSP